MKVLFAVNNDEISNAIVKKYQKNYREIISYKNVYYFNAILKELQKDKNYDRVVISEDLEPFANNNYDTIDKFLFEKIDSISDDAINEDGSSTDIILICTDRRNKSDDMLIKFFGIGVYSAILGKDRSIDEVCRLINKPRTKKEAKQYYKIDVDSVNYQAEDENSVSETEMQNILAHYKRLGRNEDKYVDSFDNIVSQYTDAQLKIIIRCLPISVKAVLEERSPKYQQLVSFNEKTNSTSLNQYNKIERTKEKSGVQAQLIEKESTKANIKQPIVIPTGVSKTQVKRLIKQEEKPINKFEQIEENLEFEELENELDFDSVEDIKENNIENIVEDVVDNTNTTENFDEDIIEESTEEVVEVKRGRGRPRKNPESKIQEESDKPKRGRGRPRKNPVIEEVVEETSDDDMDLFNLGGNEEVEETSDDDMDLFNLGGNKEVEEELDDDDAFISKNSDRNIDEDIVETNYKPTVEYNLNTLLTKDKKIVSFVGTTKNGTSFVVNNVAHMLASMGIKTAILDMTKTRNAYYIYTNSEEKLMETAKKSIYKLRSGIAEGVDVNKNLTVYTTVPDDDTEYNDVDSILGTLLKNYSVVLIDCDFNTPAEYFGASQELYLVQSMDVLTIQPLTAFLRDLQSKGVLRQEKLRIVINKGVNIKSIPIKTLIGGISKYNDPSLTIMKDLFDKDSVRYCVVPFEVQNYTKYLDSLITCTVSLNGYTKGLITALKDLSNMIYPLISKPVYSPRGDKYKDNFSNEMNDTLNKMKRKYQ